MKVVHLCTGYPISFNGGITNYVRFLAIEQAKKGMDVVVVGGLDKHGNDYGFKYIEYHDFYVKPFTLRKKKGFSSYKKIEKILKKENPDLVHIHMILDVDRRLHKILKKYGIKYIISLHDYNLLCPRIQMYKDDSVCEKVGPNCGKCATYVQQTFFLHKFFKVFKLNSEKGKLHSPEFLKIYENNKILLENAELLLPVSNRVMEIYKKSDIKNNYKVLHIGNITADSFQNYPKKKRKKDDKIKILMLGNFSKIKGGQQFIKIAKKLPHNQYEFYFLGRSTEEEKQLMRENDIFDKGSYKQADLPQLLKEYDFGCVLSVWEDNAPQVVMELLNNNIPVIGTAMGGIPDFVKNSVNGFLYNPYSPKSFDEMIEKISNLSLDEVEAMKQNITPTITTEEHFRAMQEVYNQLLTR